MTIAYRNNRGVRRLGGALLLTAALAAPVAASAQDGWTVERGDGTVSASVTFTRGQALAVRCSGRQIEVVATGLPPDPTATGMSRQIETAVDGKAVRSSAWLPASQDSTAFYTAPGALARALLTGSQLSLRSAPEGGPATRVLLPLPADRSGLETVAQACDLPLSDPHDEAVDISKIIHEISGWKFPPRPNYPAKAERSSVRGGVAILSCRVRADGSLEDCQSDFAAPAGYGFDEEALASLRTARLERDDTLTGRIIAFTIRFSLQ